jgi:hypothetical protein
LKRFAVARFVFIFGIFNLSSLKIFDFGNTHYPVLKCHFIKKSVDRNFAFRIKNDVFSGYRIKKACHSGKNKKTCPRENGDEYFLIFTRNPLSADRKYSQTAPGRLTNPPGNAWDVSVPSELSGEFSIYSL